MIRWTGRDAHVSRDVRGCSPSFCAISPKNRARVRLGFSGCAAGRHASDSIRELDLPSVLASWRFHHGRELGGSFQVRLVLQIIPFFLSKFKVFWSPKHGHCSSYSSCRTMVRPLPVLCFVSSLLPFHSKFSPLISKIILLNFLPQFLLGTFSAWMGSLFFLRAVPSAREFRLVLRGSLL